MSRLPPQFAPEELVTQLRRQGEDAFTRHYSLGMWNICVQAADLIEKLSAERDDLAGRVAEIAEAIDVAKTDTGDECRAVLAAIEKVCWRASSAAPSEERSDDEPHPGKALA